MLAVVELRPSGRLTAVSGGRQAVGWRFVPAVVGRESGLQLSADGRQTDGWRVVPAVVARKSGWLL